MVENNEVEVTHKKQLKVRKGAGPVIILDILFMLALVGGAYYVFFYEPPMDPVILDPANVELYRFSDLVGENNTLNVEIWLKNTGEETARSISIFVRVRTQYGEVLYKDLPDLTWELLGDDETCSGIYTVNYESDDKYVDHTIEIRWDSGMASCLKTTEL